MLPVDILNRIALGFFYENDAVTLTSLALTCKKFHNLFRYYSIASSFCVYKGKIYDAMGITMGYWNYLYCHYCGFGLETFEHYKYRVEYPIRAHDPFTGCVIKDISKYPFGETFTVCNPWKCKEYHKALVIAKYTDKVNKRLLFKTEVLN
jgi:hypothetical protein